MNVEQKFALIERGSVETVEIMTRGGLIRLLEEKKNPISYLGVAPTGPVHIGYLKPINKQLDLIKAGFKHRVLIADLHAYLDDLKSPWELLVQRSEYYKICLQLCGLSPEVCQYFLGSDFQMSRDYVARLYREAGMVTTARALRAASETCRLEENPHVSEMLYPLLQINDQISLKVDLSYGGLDQRHVYALGREILPRMNLNPPVAIFTERSPGLKEGTGMSASQPETTIQVHDSEKEIDQKILKAYCPQGIIKGNPIIEILKYFIMPRYPELIIERPQKFGGEIRLKEPNELTTLYESGKLHPADLKANTARYLKEVLRPARKFFEQHPEILSEAFPSMY